MPTSLARRRVLLVAVADQRAGAQAGRRRRGLGKKVVVVGAGPAGAAAAVLLSRYGVEVLLVERETSPERVFRGEGLLPLGVDALHEMGLDAVLDEVPSRTIGSWDIWIDGEEVFVVPEPVARLGGRAVRVVSQPALLQGLLGRAARSPGFRFSPGTRRADLKHDDRGASSVPGW
jgi:2-polyprenyl-6-methoxyphenol hydroxylase-like FAD-dependent oxidoreductase